MLTAKSATTPLDHQICISRQISPIVVYVWDVTGAPPHPLLSEGCCLAVRPFRLRIIGISRTALRGPAAEGVDSPKCNAFNVMLILNCSKASFDGFLRSSSTQEPVCQAIVSFQT